MPLPPALSLAASREGSGKPLCYILSILSPILHDAWNNFPYGRRSAPSFCCLSARVFFRAPKRR
ncbi:protein of unknown function [Paraburkholderia dioscoreae]|uniref:Uncharacterized protein n=1 Tax=Paraburkholderia dioscoreae TaxID=2604047 RepID=A0A5Q4ZGG3_9BURK|nr:protein of unknown function [Paraburkholderia dioscoreae]